MQMKPVFTLLFCLSVLTVFAQNEQFKIKQALIQKAESLINQERQSLQSRGEECLLVASREDDWVDEAWVPTDSSYFFYDSLDLNNETLELILVDGVWENSRLRSSEYENELLSYVLSQRWDAGTWENEWQIFYEYDNDLLLSSTSQNWIDGELENSLRITYSYLPNNDLEELLFEVGDGQDWQIWFKVDYYYDAEGFLVETINQNFDVYTGVYENSNRTLYTYDSADLLIEEFTFLWDGSNWYQWSRILYENDGVGNRLKRIRQQYDEALDVYENVFQNLYTYDFDQNLTLFVDQNWEMEAWVNDFQIIRYYEMTISNLSEVNTDQVFSIGPNPAQSFLRLVFGQDLKGPLQIQVWSEDGRLLESKMANTTNVALNTSHWASGTYVIQVIGADLNVSRKVMKF